MAAGGPAGTVGVHRQLSADDTGNAQSCAFVNFVGRLRTKRLHFPQSNKENEVSLSFFFLFSLLPFLPSSRFSDAAQVISEKEENIPIILCVPKFIPIFARTLVSPQVGKRAFLFYKKDVFERLSL